MKTQGIFVAAVAVVAGLAMSAAAAPIPISSCGAEVPARRTGVLTNDVQCQLYCTDFPSVPCSPGCPLDPDDSCRSETIRLGRGAKLRLDGHTIAGAYNRTAILCVDERPGGTCTVVGPGEVQSNKGSAIGSLDMNVRVRDLLMAGSYGAIQTLGKVDVRGSVFGSWDYDVYGASTIRLVDTTSGQGGGFYATKRIDLRNVETRSSLFSDGRIVGRGVTLVGGTTTMECPRVEAPVVRVAKLVAQGCTP